MTSDAARLEGTLIDCDGRPGCWRGFLYNIPNSREPSLLPLTWIWIEIVQEFSPDGCGNAQLGCEAKSWRVTGSQRRCGRTVA